jgi:hypothetical protein
LVTATVLIDLSVEVEVGGGFRQDLVMTRRVAAIVASSP